MKKICYAIAIALTVALSAAPSNVEAQCPMCRMSVESNLQNGGTAGKGLNNGILYLLMMPYLLVGTVGYIWWRHRRREQELLDLHD